MLDLHRYKAGNYTHNHGIWANVCKRGRKGDVRGCIIPTRHVFTWDLSSLKFIA